MAISVLAIRGHWVVDEVTFWKWDPTLNTARRMYFTFGNGLMSVSTLKSVARDKFLIDALHQNIEPESRGRRAWISWTQFDASRQRFALYRFSLRQLGFHWGQSGVEHFEKSFQVEREFTFPISYALLVSAVLPVAVVIPYARRRRRLQSGTCLICGYDLRASKDRCPECGTAIDTTGESGRGEER